MRGLTRWWMDGREAHGERPRHQGVQEEHWPGKDDHMISATNGGGTTLHGPAYVYHFERDALPSRYGEWSDVLF